MTEPGLTVACPSCSSRLRLARRDLPARFKVTCPKCATGFVIKRREGGNERTVRLEESDGAHSVVAKETRASPSVKARGQELQTQPSGPQLTFRIGELVAGRYRVERFLAKGGMGEVYEAFDTALETAIALKTIRPDLASDSLAVDRFVREINVARQVTHRNVCRIFDLGHHVGNSALASLYPDGRILCVTMELLRGETLSARLRRDGPLTKDEALPVVEQMAAALDAAHAAGIVHRDLKSMNVILEPATGSGSPRAVITDFGLARSAGQQMSGATLTVAGAVLGSPAYMAPEQIEGDGVTPSADIYALGVMLYEMMTGKLPFKGESPMATAFKRLTENPAPPSQHRPELEGRWEGAILGCMERRPESRFPSGDAVVAAITGRDEPKQPVEIAGVPRKRIVRAALAGFLLAAALATNFWVWNRRAVDEVEAAGILVAPSTARPAIAVMGFRNATGEADVAWMSRGLSEMLTSELVAGGGVRVVPGENVVRTATELDLAVGDTYAFETLTRLRSVLGADYIVSGSFTAVDDDDGGRLRLDVRLQDTVSEGSSTAVSVDGRSAQLFDLVAEAGSKMRSELQVVDSVQVDAHRAASPEAVRLYSEGVEALNSGDALGARDLLEQAVEEDPRSPRPRAALAKAYSSLGYAQRARDEAKKALDNAGALPEDERQEIRAQYLELSGSWVEASEAYEALWRKYPDDLEYGLELAQAFTSAGRAAQALQVCDVLEKLPSAAAGDVRILFARATAAGALGRFEEQREAAAEAASRSHESGARLLRAQALVLEGWALRNLGDADRAQGVTAEAEGLFQQAGDEAGVARARVQRATLLFDQGDLDTARRMFERAIVAYEELGDKGSQAQALNNLAVVRRQQGDIEDARRLYEQSLRLSEETSNRFGIANALTNIGAIESKIGALGRALERFETALEIARSIGDRSQEAYALYNRGVTHRKLGDLAAAEADHTAALDLRREMGQRIGEAAALRDLGIIALERADAPAAVELFESAQEKARAVGDRRFQALALSAMARVRLEEGSQDEARILLEEALLIQRSLGELSSIAETQYLLARVELSEANAGRAEEIARESAEAFRLTGLADDEALSNALRARALVFLDRLTEARELSDRAEQRARVTESVALGLEIEMAWARVRAAANASGAAITRLRDVQRRAQQSDLTLRWLEARLEHALILTGRGDTAAAQEMFGEVAVLAGRGSLGRLEALASR